MLFTLGKLLVDLLLVTNFFLPGVTADAVERMSVESHRFHSNMVSLAQNLGRVGCPPPTNRSCQKTRMNDLSCGIRMWAQVSFVLSQCI